MWPSALFTLSCAWAALGLVASAEPSTLFESTVDADCKKKLEGTKIADFVSPTVYTFKDSDNEYKYELGICNNVVPDSRIVVTQTELQQDAKRTVSVGRLNDIHLVSRDDYAELTYYYGDVYNSHCKNTHRTARIMFVCDPCAGKGYPEVVEEYATDSSTTENQHCFYLFEWATSNVCNKAAAGRLIVCKPTGLGAGSIFLIVLLSVGVAYVILGFIFNRFVRGAKGNEQFPNYSFWITCGDHISDGCDVLCRSKPPSIQMKSIPSVGRGDHQLDLSEDELA
ncbi:cation-dependent mannose-6-phosphate receptor-like isoform X2 [Sycon ciliatum]|uniref:cation-dependent mannose-6-phosphate receptor-like isoform X2 n=1 Tax=Sycon ciliatum TaxID=27933 RepID=UPI0031F68BA7